MTRWQPDMTYTIDGIDLRISQGDKFPGDLVLWARGSDGQWRKVKMTLAFFLVDFLSDNEDRRREHVPFWRQNGQSYFLKACVDAARSGWRKASEKVARQRDAA